MTETAGEDVEAEFSLTFSDGAASFLADWRATQGDPWARNRAARKHLDHLLHTRRFQIAVIGLVLLDACIVVAELAIDVGLLDSGGRSSLQGSPWPHVLHSVSLAILSFFLLETFAKLYAMGLAILRHKMELFDMFVITISFGLDVASAMPGSQLTALFGLVVLLRLWRIVRIVNSIALSIRLQGRKSLAKQSELRKQAEDRCAEFEGRVAELSAGLQEALKLVGSGDSAVATEAALRRLRSLLPVEQEATAVRESSPGDGVVHSSPAGSHVE